jgi:hypothetical protein
MYSTSFDSYQKVYWNAFEYNPLWLGIMCLATIFPIVGLFHFLDLKHLISLHSIKYLKFQPHLYLFFQDYALNLVNMG